MVWILHRLGTSHRVLVFGLLYFVLNIALSQSVLLIDNFMANRYAYLAYPGLFLILAEFNERILRGGKAVHAAVRHAWTAALVLLAVGFAFLTYSRNLVWRDTIALFDDVIAKQPDIPWVYSNRGVARYRVGDYAGALSDFNRSLELDPRFALSLYYRGVLSREAGDYPAALVDLDATISLVPDFAYAYNDRGKVRRALGDPDGALQDFSQAIALNPRFVEAYFNRGTLRHEFGDHAGAVADLDQAIADFPEYAEAYYHRALAHLALGQDVAACSDVRTALDLGFQPSAQLIEQACP
jgi:tetratricopeptide (TPR) repeat protein